MLYFDDTREPDVAYGRPGFVGLWVRFRLVQTGSEMKCVSQELEMVVESDAPNVPACTGEMKVFNGDPPSPCALALVCEDNAVLVWAKRVLEQRSERHYNTTGIRSHIWFCLPPPRASN